jgi:ferredoxin
MAMNIKINFSSYNKVHKGNSFEMLLDQGEAAGIIMPYSCRGGMCGRCKARLTSGKVNEIEDQALTTAEKEAGYILLCSSTPKTDVIIEHIK